jgi:hypothetical protein
MVNGASWPGCSSRAGRRSSSTGSGTPLFGRLMGTPLPLVGLFRVTPQDVEVQGGEDQSPQRTGPRRASAADPARYRAQSHVAIPRLSRRHGGRASPPTGRMAPTRSPAPGRRRRSIPAIGCLAAASPSALTWGNASGLCRCPAPTSGPWRAARAYFQDCSARMRASTASLTTWSAAVARIMALTAPARVVSPAD